MNPLETAKRFLALDRTYADADLPTANPPELDALSDEDCERIYGFALEILDKKYLLYQWTDGRVNTIVTINGLLIGGLLVLPAEKRFTVGDSFSEIARFTVPLLLFALSLGILLFHMAPKMDSGVGNEKLGNPRQVAGTEKHLPAEYLMLLVDLNIRDQIRHASNQIKGMNRIVMLNNDEIRRAILITIAGLIAMLYWIIEGI